MKLGILNTRVAVAIGLKVVGEVLSGIVFGEVMYEKFRTSISSANPCETFFSL